MDFSSRKQNDNQEQQPGEPGGAGPQTLWRSGPDADASRLTNVMRIFAFHSPQKLFTALPGGNVASSCADYFFVVPPLT
jgi:hypothetical protein